MTSGVAPNLADDYSDDVDDDEARFEYEIDTVPTFLAAWGEVTS